MNTKKLIVLCAALLSVGVMEARLVFTTINNPGFYQLSDELDNSVTIEVSDVTFDLNGHTITASNGIIINAGLDNVTVTNGNIQATNDGILVNSGCTNITLDALTVEGAIRGINFENVTGGLISNCDMTMNTTGLELDNSHKITVKDCVANCNTHAGYDLISSTTNCFENCKALSTGEGNSDQFDTTVFGFVSTNGRGNIFERCIANSTQALTTTDSNSEIAGFAFRGSEGCSKIIDSEAANSQTSSDGFTIPYGILLEATTDMIQSVTGALGSPGTVWTIDWSPDGQYVALGGGSSLNGGPFQIFRFDATSGALHRVAAALTANTIYAVNWSPDGQHIGVGGADLSGGNELQIFAFDRFEETLNHVTGALGTDGEVRSISWLFDGQYIAVGQRLLSSGNSLKVVKFDRVTESLSTIATALSNTEEVFATHWSPDGNYIAVGGAGITGNQLQVFSFNRSEGTLNSVDGALGATGTVRSVKWSSDGYYLAAGGDSFSTTEELYIFRFTRASETLDLQDSEDLGAAAIQEVSWSSDGRYVVIGGSALTGGTGNDVQIFQFDRASSLLVSKEGFFGTSEFVFSTVISPDGRHIAVGGNSLTSGSTNEFQIITGLQFPEKNVITGNTVYCNSGSQFPSGIGISGSSIANMIVGNVSYAHPIVRGTNAPITSSNYAYVTNIFKPLFNQAPSDIQNISLNGCDPIDDPNDVNLLIKQIRYKVCNLESQSDVIESKIDIIDSAVSAIDSIDSVVDIIESKVCEMDSQLDVVESKIDELGACGFTSLSSADVSAGAIDLSTPGNYCLAEDITANITISSNNITLDLNKRQLTGTITMTVTDVSNVTIKNGFLSAPAPTSSPSAAIGFSFPFINPHVGPLIIENVAIHCVDTSTANQGRSCISLVAGGVPGGIQIRNCSMKAGAAGGVVEGNGVRGGHGIILNGTDYTIIDNCIILAGLGGSGASAGFSGGDGGSGIVLQGSSTDIVITGCIISTQIGGLGDVTGGNGGNGITIEGASAQVVIEKTTILETGNGGGATTTGGNGGHGIFINSMALDISVRNCTIQNTGAGGTGSTTGAPGKAIDDDVIITANLSQIFSNFAHNIANSTKFDLQAAGEAGILTPNPPTATVINPFANVYSS